MGRRPNTMTPKTFVSINEDDLNQMDDAALIDFADRILGLVIAPGTKRSTILTRIVNAAVAVKDRA